MTASLQNANMTRVKRGRNAKMTQHDAKNNARITRNNAAVCGSRAELGAAYVLYSRELRSDVGSNLEKYYPVIVNSKWSGGAANPGSGLSFIDVDVVRTLRREGSANPGDRKSFDRPSFSRAKRVCRRVHARFSPGRATISPPKPRAVRARQSRRRPARGRNSREPWRRRP